MHWTHWALPVAAGLSVVHGGRAGQERAAADQREGMEMATFSSNQGYQPIPPRSPEEEGEHARVLREQKAQRCKTLKKVGAIVVGCLVLGGGGDLIWSRQRLLHDQELAYEDSMSRHTKTFNPHMVGRDGWNAYPTTDRFKFDKYGRVVDPKKPLVSSTMESRPGFHYAELGEPPKYWQPGLKPQNLLAMFFLSRHPQYQPLPLAGNTQYQEHSPLLLKHQTTYGPGEIGRLCGNEFNAWCDYDGTGKDTRPMSGHPLPIPVPATAPTPQTGGRRLAKSKSSLF